MKLFQLILFCILYSSIKTDFVAQTTTVISNNNPRSPVQIPNQAHETAADTILRASGSGNTILASPSVVISNSPKVGIVENRTTIIDPIAVSHVNNEATPKGSHTILVGTRPADVPFATGNFSFSTNNGIPPKQFSPFRGTIDPITIGGNSPRIHRVMPSFLEKSNQFVETNNNITPTAVPAGSFVVNSEPFNVLPPQVVQPGGTINVRPAVEVSTGVVNAFVNDSLGTTITQAGPVATVPIAYDLPVFAPEAVTNGPNYVKPLIEGPIVKRPLIAKENCNLSKPLIANRKRRIGRNLVIGAAVHRSDEMVVPAVELSFLEKKGHGHTFVEKNSKKSFGLKNNHCLSGNCSSTQKPRKSNEANRLAEIYGKRLKRTNLRRN